MTSTRRAGMSSQRIGTAWREMLRTGLAPPAYRSRTRPASPRIARTKPARACMQATIAAIDASLREERRPLGDITNTY